MARAMFGGGRQLTNLHHPIPFRIELEEGNPLEGLGGLCWQKGVDVLLVIAPKVYC